MKLRRSRLAHPQLDSTQALGLISSPSKSYLFTTNLHEKIVLLGQYNRKITKYTGGKSSKSGGNGIIS